MLETKEQKQIFAGCAVLVIVLGVVSYFSRPNFQFQDKTDYIALKARSDKQQQAYAAFLASIGSTPAAQAALYEEILPPGEVAQEVTAELGADQNITVPDKPQTKISAVNDAGKSAVAKFIAASSPISDKVKNISDTSAGDLFNTGGSAAQIDSLIGDLSGALTAYSKISVPKEAAAFQNHELVALEAYLDLARASKAYMANPSAAPWPQMYKDYSIIYQSSAAAKNDFSSLNQKYNLLGEAEPASVRGNLLIPAAKAQGVSVVTDIWQKAWVGIEEALAASVARFELAFLNSLSVKIEQAYRISNFLYYTDALVSGEYADDYLNKYVSSPFDRNIIKNMLPEVSCGNTPDNSAVFQAKAAQSLGFDPASLNPNDPNFYQKMARVGDFMSTSQGWQLYYQGQAEAAQAAARQAANNELLSNGNKTARDQNGNIAVTSGASLATLQAAIQSQLDLSQSGNAGYPTAANIAAQITQTFLNSFVFQGAVLKEQNACISTPQVQLLTSVPLGTAPRN